jgi:hypothetical protein
MTEHVVTAPVSAATLELLDWVSRRPRTYTEAIDAWRSNCPRHPVWDDALTAGLVRIVRCEAGNRSEVALTALGRVLLDGRQRRLRCSK